MPRILLIFIILFLNAAYIYVLSAVNTELAPAAYLLLPAVLIIPAALFLKFVPMLAVVAFSAFLSDASTPVRPGLNAALWMVSAFAVHGMRFRFLARDWFSVTVLAEILNIILFFFYALFFYGGSRSIADYAARISTDALASALALALVAKFCVSLPVSVANILGVEMSISEDD